MDKEVRKRAKESDEAKRLTGIPGIGPICAMAIQAFAPPMLVAAALANKMARTVWAVATKKEIYKAPASA